MSTDFLSRPARVQEAVKGGSRELSRETLASYVSPKAWADWLLVSARAQACAGVRRRAHVRAACDACDVRHSFSFILIALCAARNTSIATKLKREQEVVHFAFFGHCLALEARSSLCVLCEAVACE
jgi:hypothetical protein